MSIEKLECVEETKHKYLLRRPGESDTFAAFKRERWAKYFATYPEARKYMKQRAHQRVEIARKALKVIEALPVNEPLHEMPSNAIEAHMQEDWISNPILAPEVILAEALAST